MLNENKPTILKLEHGGTVQTVELPWDANMLDMLQAFYGLCIGATWQPSTVIEGMYDFVQQSDTYNWTPINDIVNGPEYKED